MKILYLITIGEPGGAQKYVSQLAKHFHGTVASGGDAAWLQAECQQNGVNFFKLKHLKRAINPLRDLLALWEIIRLVKNIKPDLIHANSSKAGFLASIAGKLTGTKVIFTAHGFSFNESRPAWLLFFARLLEQLSASLRAFTILVSDKERQQAIGAGIVKASNSKTIYHGLEPINFLSKQDARTKLNLPADGFIVGTIANFYQTKGLDILIEAAAKVTFAKVTFAVIGSGSLENALRKQIHDSQLSDKVLLLGQFTNAAQYLQAFDAFVSSSRKEGFPFVLLEAMQAGLPIVATKVGGVPELLGQAGMIVESPNPNELANAINRLAEDSNLRDTLKQKASHRQTEFSLDEMLAQTNQIYNSCLGKVSD